MKNKDSKCIVAIAPDQSMNQVSWDVVRAVSKSMTKYGLYLAINFYNGDDEALVASIAVANPRAVITAANLSDSAVRQLTAMGISIVPVLVYSQGEENPILRLQASIVDTQVAHLVSHGCQNLAYIDIDGYDISGLADLRYRAAIKSCQDRGLPVPKRISISLNAGTVGADLLKSVRRGTKKLIDGCCCFNDDTAIATIHGLRQCGLTVPGDVRIVGVDDLPQSAVTNPTLTTVAYDSALMGQLGMALILQGMGIETDLPDVTAVEYSHLVVRESA